MSASAPTTLPRDLSDYIAALDDADRRAEDLVSSLTDTQVNWQPHNGGAWSASQCLEHMGATNQIYLAALREAAKRAKAGHRQLAAAGWLSRFFLKKTEPPVTLKIKAPGKIRPSQGLTKAQALHQFHESNQALRDFSRNAADLDLCGTRFKNPFIPGLNFTIATGLLVIAAHNRRHLWQMEQVLKDPAFPRR